MSQTTKPHLNENFADRIMLRDMTCPLIRLNEARRKDKKIGFFVSVLIHLVLFGGASFLLVSQSQFAVDQGKSGMEVNLIAAANPQPQEKVVMPPVIPEKSDFEQPVPEPIKNQPEPQPQQQTVGKDEVTAQSQGGAISEAKPDYFNNPAPEYPFEARKKGWFGTVILRVSVDKQGNPGTIEVEQSSGHSLLDKTAVKAVRGWKFLPAKLGDMSIDSTVKVPIRFDLKDA